MTNLPNIAIVADDLTGSADSAVQFASVGMATAVVMPDTEIPHNNQLEVIVLDSESRDINKDDAYNAVKDSCKKLLSLNKDILLYKKVDSTLRGNIGAELQSVYDEFGAQIIIFSPAFIPSKRITINGIQYLNGKKLEETELANIPKSPVTTSVIEDIIKKQCSLSCAHLYIDDLNKSVSEIREKISDLIKEGAKIIICDASETKHQTDLIKATSAFEKVIYSGSAGLAQALSAEHQKTYKKEIEQPKVKKILVLAGSISQSTRLQTHLLVQEYDCELIRTQPELTVANPAQSAKECCTQIRNALKSKDIVVVSAAFEEDDVRRTELEGKARGKSFFEIGETMATCMSLIMKESAELFDGFVITGGDTAIHACKATDAGILEVVEEVQSGIPLTKILTGNLKNRYLVTKAGAFGNEKAFSDAVKKLKHLE